jgi:hypothetical protein
MQALAVLHIEVQAILEFFPAHPTLAVHNKYAQLCFESENIICSLIM